MAKLGISTGTTPNDGTGDSLLASGIKINSNFSEIYSAIGDGTNITNSINYASISGIATYATKAGIATYATNAGIATYATNAGVSTYATNAGIATNVIGGIASVTQLRVSSGITTLGITSATNLTAQQLNVSGLSTFSGIATHTASLFGTTASFTGVITASSFSGNASSATYATNAGIATYATNAGIATYATNAGIATYATTSGISTYASTAGIATYSGTSGISTVSQGLTGTPNITVGIVTATSFFGSGTNLTGIVTSIVAGTGVTISGSTGQVTINATGGSGTSYWSQTAAGIHTLSNVGVGTTNPTSTLTVGAVGASGTSLLVNGNARITGITTHQDAISIRPLVSGNEYVSISPYGRMVLGSSAGTTAGIDIINNTTSASAEIFTISTPDVNLYDKKIIVDYGGRLLLGGNLDSSLNNAYTVLDNSGNITLTGYVSAGGTIGASGLNVGTGGTVITTTTTGLVGINSTAPAYTLDVSGNARVGINTSQGVILTSPDGTKYRLFVENDGTLKTVLVP